MHGFYEVLLHSPASTNPTSFYTYATTCGSEVDCYTLLQYNSTTIDPLNYVV